MPISKLLPTLFVAAFALSASYASAQNAQSILSFRASSNDGGIALASNVLGTTDDGDVGTTGDQTTAVSFDNFLGSIDDIQVGSVTLSGITLNMGVEVLSGSPDTAFLTTSGGQISVFDDNNSLLLSGNLGEQVFSGPVANGALTASGSIFSSGADNGITFDGGSLLQFLDGDSGDLSITLSSILTDGTPGLVLAGGTVEDFTANVSGQILASTSGVPVSAIPEPTALPMLIFGLALFSSTRKRSSVA